MAKIEILSPAGSMESLRAALSAGADAVYFGGRAFSNRMRAKNFEGNEICDAIKLCHSCGAKAYITVNTRVRDREMAELLQFAEGILQEGDGCCDSIIAADLGVAAEIKKRFPHATLHASTQTSMSSPEDCKALSELGFSRIVLPRELSLAEIKDLSNKTNMELEMFIHGAHCVSLSGQCLMSCMMGGRSGNRGECAQPCRLPYRMSGDGGRKESYPLSLADMCLGGRMTDVMSSGVCSLKIEGRLKSAGYVYGVTKIYRTLADENRNATPLEIEALSSLFTRGFTDGYFTSKYRTMSGKVSSGSAEVSNGEVSDGLNRRIKKAASDAALQIKASLELGKDFSKLTLTAEGESVSVNGELPTESKDKPLTVDGAYRSLSKLGGTGLTLGEEDLSFTSNGELWMPASALNDLRRRGAELLLSALRDKKSGKEKTDDPLPAGLAGLYEYEKSAKLNKNTHRGEKIAVLETPHGLYELQKRRDFTEFAGIYAQSEDYVTVKNLLGDTTAELCASLPVLIPSEDRLSKILDELFDKGCRRVMCHTAGQVYLAREKGMVCDMSYRGNITNTVAYNYYKTIGCERVTLSPELPEKAVSAIGGGGIAYGRLPLMHLSRCLGLKKPADGNKKCVFGRNHSDDLPLFSEGDRICTGELIDRLGKSFPVIGRHNCVNIVYNSVSMDKESRYDMMGVSHLEYYFM